MKRSLIYSAIALFATLAPVSLQASSDSAWEALFAEARKACEAASGLKKAEAIGAPTDFSGKVLVLVNGRWPQPHMKNAEATFGCLYDKKAKQAEAQEVQGFTATAR